MKKLVMLGALVLAAVPAQAQSAADSAEIRATALDYVEGWYAGDAERMQSSLHPELAKRIVQTNAEGVSRLGHMGAERLVNGTRDGGGKDTPAEKQVKGVAILDIFNGTASVRADMTDWIDYMHMAKWNGKWVIVNVLWQTRPRR